MAMQLYNKGKRSFIVNKKDVVAGGRSALDGTNKDMVWIDADTFITLNDKVGAKLLKMYPKELKDVGQPVKQKKRPAKKAAKKSQEAA